MPAIQMSGRQRLQQARYYLFFEKERDTAPECPQEVVCSLASFLSLEPRSVWCTLLAPSLSCLLDAFTLSSPHLPFLFFLITRNWYVRNIVSQDPDLKSDDPGPCLWVLGGVTCLSGDSEAQHENTLPGASNGGTRRSVLLAYRLLIHTIL